MPARRIQIGPLTICASHEVADSGLMRLKSGATISTTTNVIEWSSHRIRVNAEGAAYVEAEMSHRKIEAGKFSRAASERRIPLGRLADADSFLLSDAANFMTGQSLYGGRGLAYEYL